jgi:hypothetical protein
VEFIAVLRCWRARDAADRTYVTHGTYRTHGPRPHRSSRSNKSHLVAAAKPPAPPSS